eukprot:TRINITY_DN10897_c0_g1_i2.p1 TRINITY_DN10897_c0_g1~~TRINITY_DN10897_c0_g1_i2.p1  ORF type:complete len:141 (-),score=35.44 TRINITY_DN10897_c0_g1_i2:126-548(-)
MICLTLLLLLFFFFQAEDGIRDLVRSRGLGSQQQLKYLNYVPRKDLIYPSRAASVLHAQHPEHRANEALMLGSCMLPAEDRKMAHQAHAWQQMHRLKGPEAELFNAPLAPDVTVALHKEANRDGYEATCRTAKNAPKSQY